MALFPATDVYDARPDAVRPVAGGWLGWLLLVVAAVAIVAIALIPAPYVVQKPGPVFDTLGDVTIDEELVPLIEIPMQETFPTKGSLNMLTVVVEGNRENRLNWFQVGTAWLDRSKAVLPIDSVYSPEETVEQSNEQSRIAMEVSQQEAIAAALRTLDYQFPSVLTVADVGVDSPAAGVLEPGDIITSVNGETFADVTALRTEIAKNGIVKPAVVSVTRDGVPLIAEIVPVMSTTGTDADAPILGVIISSEYDFPFDVTIQLENVGGPSAGQMFALGIIDKLTPGQLNGGADVAGTGTISGAGEIGPIGGIRQKMYGALAERANYFLAPADNCDEVTGHIPDGLEVFAVSTLDESLLVLEGIAEGRTEGLPTCPIE
jgi:PDZ domain-containing protein